MAEISVVIPIHNVEQFLSRCLTSVLNQTFEDIEIIGVNDGSTDGSLRILESLAQKDTRIRVFSKENGGAPSAWQYGLERVTGRYLIFLDADDYIEPCMYEKLYKSIRENDADMSVSGYFKDYADHIEAMENRWEIKSVCENTEEVFRYAFIRDQYRNFGTFLWNKLVRTDIVRENAISFDESLARGADVLFFSDVASKVRRMAYTAQHLYHYMQWDMSLTKMRSYEKCVGILTAYDGVIRKGEEQGFSDETMKYIKRFYAFHAGQMIEWALTTNSKDIIQKSRNNLMKYYTEYLNMNKDDPERLKWMETLVRKSDANE